MLGIRVGFAFWEILCFVCWAALGVYVSVFTGAHSVAGLVFFLLMLAIPAINYDEGGHSAFFGLEDHGPLLLGFRTARI